MFCGLVLAVVWLGLMLVLDLLLSDTIQGSWRLDLGKQSSQQKAVEGQGEHEAYVALLFDLTAAVNALEALMEFPAGWSFCLDHRFLRFGMSPTLLKHISPDIDEVIDAIKGVANVIAVCHRQRYEWTYCYDTDKDVLREVYVVMSRGESCSSLLFVGMVFDQSTAKVRS